MIDVKIDVFEGSFDLLYKLIEKNKIDIYDIPISLITDQYLKEVENMKKKDANNIGQFLIMAATLLKIKSKLLLPKVDDEDNEDPRVELVNKLVEYKKYKEVSEVLKNMEDTTGNMVVKPNNNILKNIRTSFDDIDLLKDINIEQLTDIFNKVIKTQRLIDDNYIKEKVKKTVIKKRIYTIEEQIEVLEDRLKFNKKIKFQELFCSTYDKMEKIITFLALLELIKLKKIAVQQNTVFDDIYITRLEI